MRDESILVLGIGNTLLADEGVGVRVVERLAVRQAEFPDVRFVDGGTLSFTLAEHLHEADYLVVVDAARMNLPPGSVRSFVDDGMDVFLRGNRRSVHEVGLLDLLDIARLSGVYPRSKALVGIEPEAVTWGELTPIVQRAVPEAAAQVLMLIEQWSLNTKVKKIN